MSGDVARVRRRAAFGARFGGGFRAVFERDFLVLTSAGKFVLLRTIVLLALGGLTALILYTFGERQLLAHRSPDEVGRAVFTGFAIAYPILAVLVGPALAAASIAGERAMDTLPLVLAAPVRPISIVFAKFLSRLGALMVPLVGGLPIAAICFLYGGISQVLFVEWILVVLALAVVGVASSVVASAYSRTVAGAVLGAYFLGVVVPGLETWLGCWLHYEEFKKTSPTWLAEHTPGHAVAMIVEAVWGRGTTRGDVTPFFYAAIVGSALALLVAAARVGREAQEMAAGGPQRGRVRRQVFANPVLDRACLAIPFRRGGWKSWTSLVVVTGLTALIPLVDFDDDTVIVAMNVCTWVTAIVLLARASQSLATERQQGSLAVLLATRLGSREIVLGKLAGLALLGALLLLPGVVVGVLGVAYAKLPPACVFTWLGASAVTLLLFTSLGLWVSSRATTAGKAAGLAFALGIGGMVAHGLLLLAIAIVGRSEDVLIPLSSASPPGLVAVLSNAPRAQGGGGGGADQKFVAWTIFWSVAYGVGSLLLLAASQRRTESEV